MGIIEITLGAVAIILPFACAVLMWCCEPENSWDMRMSRWYKRIEACSDPQTYEREMRRWGRAYGRVTDRRFRRLLRAAARGVRKGVIGVDMPHNCSFEDYLKIKHLL